MRKWWLLGALLVSPSVSACINPGPTTDHAGRRFEMYEFSGDARVKYMTRPHAQESWRSRKEEIIDQALAEPDFDSLTDLGVLLIYQDNYAAATRLFVRIEALYPGRHQTAANLGTSLELMGRDALALRWIRLGIHRDRREHEGTEWLHARILTTKLALKDDPRFLEGRSVAGVAFDLVVVPSLPKAYPDGNDSRPVKPYELEKAFAYQLHERLPFVKPKDPVVANLLSDWANAQSGRWINRKRASDLPARRTLRRATYALDRGPDATYSEDARHSGQTRFANRSRPLSDLSAPVAAARPIAPAPSWGAAAAPRALRSITRRWLF